MPELPEVEGMLRPLRTALLGETLSKVEFGPFAPSVILGMPGLLEAGFRLEHIGRHGKVALLRFGPILLVLQLGMSGRLLLRPARGVHDHLILHFRSGRVLTLSDHRRFGRAFMLPASTACSLAPLKDLGPDALTGPMNTDRLRTGSRPIKLKLLDQSVVAGLGNIYACESLYRAKIDPSRRCDSLSEAEAEQLRAVIPNLLQEAIAVGGTTLEDYRGTEGESGTFERQLAVYGRAGQVCLNRFCHNTIQSIRQSGRPTFFCAACQK